MTELDEYGRPEPPVAADGVTTLLGFLDWQRATLAWKCSALDGAGLRATTAASTMTLGGIVKHMALVEYIWFSRWLHGRWYALPMSRRCLTAVTGSASWPSGPGPTAVPPACAGSCAT